MFSRYNCSNMNRTTYVSFLPWTSNIIMYSCNHNGSSSWRRMLRFYVPCELHYIMFSTFFIADGEKCSMFIQLSHVQHEFLSIEMMIISDYGRVTLYKISLLEKANQIYFSTFLLHFVCVIINILIVHWNVAMWHVRKPIFNICHL